MVAGLALAPQPKMPSAAVWPPPGAEASEDGAAAAAGDGALELGCRKAGAAAWLGWWSAVVVAVVEGGRCRPLNAPATNTYTQTAITTGGQTAAHSHSY